MLDAWSSFSRSCMVTVGGQAAQDAPASLLLEPLEALPDVFAAHVLPHLPPEARSCSKQACSLGQLAVYSVTTSAAVDHRRHDEELKHHVPGDRWVRRDAWQNAFAGFPVYLGRLPSLTTIKLTGWPSETELSLALLACGEATQGRVTSLALHCGWLTVSALCAVPLAFPRLAELAIHHPATDCGADDCACCRPDLQGPLLLPLQGLQSLTKLSYITNDDDPNTRDLLSSLGRLSSLRDLRLYLDSVRVVDLHLLSGLVNLRTCDIWCPNQEDTTLVDFSPLFSATHLTSLKLISAHSSGAEDSSPAAVAAAMARLGALTALRSLVLSSSHGVDDATFSAVRRLTLLTELKAGLWQLTAPPGPGHLPLLQHLGVGDENEYLQPAQLLRALQPLLPLASLTALTNGALSLEVSHQAHSSAMEQRDELRKLVGHLRAAPRLRLPGGVELSCAHDTDPLVDSGEGLTRALLALRPLSHPYSRVLLYMFEALEPQWGCLMRGLGGLLCLELRDCRLRGLHLTCLLRHLTALTHLELRHCAIERGTLEEVAGECGRPLVMEVVGCRWEWRRGAGRCSSGCTAGSTSRGRGAAR